ncbi:hypothetical protein PHMEG_00028670, partial [Phytophthora megakarya]
RVLIAVSTRRPRRPRAAPNAIPAPPDPAQHKTSRRACGCSTGMPATLCVLEAASGIPRSTLQRHLKNKVLRRFISRVKPALTNDHKLQRLTWDLAQVQRVHIDEKWFNMYKASSRYYFLPMKHYLTDHVQIDDILV